MWEADRQIQQQHGHVQAKSSLRRDQPCQHRDARLLVARVKRKSSPATQATSQWCLVMAA